MTILNFQRPDKVYMIKSDDYFGVFEFYPLEQGYGITVGNALRRVLLNSLEGYAITSIKIEGVEHEFSTIKGVVEDVTELILNLKQVRFRQQIEGIDEEVLTISLSGKDKFLAKDIGDFTSAFQVLNTDHVICNLDKKVKLNIEMVIRKARGYVPSEENKPKGEDIQPGMIYIDSIHTPIKHVKYSVENYRVGQKTDYEKLIFEISTDGSIAPVDSLKEAAKILIKYFMLFSDEQITLGNDDKKGIKTFDEESLHMRQLLKTRLSSLDLSVRALNCLKSSDIDTLGDLVQYSKHDLLKFRNFGKKSLLELEELLVNKKLDFGMDVSEFNLDKE